MRKVFYAFALNIVNKATTAIIFFFLARWVGAQEAGTYTTGLSYALLFGALVAGLDDLLIREANFKPPDTALWFVNLAALRLLLSLLLWGCIAALAWLLPYQRETTYLIILLGSALLPDGLMATCNSVLVARRQMGLAAGLSALVGAVKIGAALYVLLQGMGLAAVILVSVAGSWLAALIYLLVVAVQLRAALTRSAIKLSFWWLQLRRILPFLLIGLLSTFEYQFDILFLSVFKGETEVGWYSSTTTFLWALWMVPVAYRMVYFPIFSELARRTPERVPALFWKSIQYLLSFALPVVAATSLLSPAIIRLVYGDGYEPSMAILASIVWSLPFVYMGVPNMRVLLAFERQEVVTRFLVVTLGVNVAANLLLVPWLGGVGAALARVLSSAAFWWVSWRQVRTLVAPAPPLKGYLPMLLATLACTGLVWLGQNWSLLLIVPAGGLLYALVLWWSGGVPPELLLALRGRFKGWFHV